MKTKIGLIIALLILELNAKSQEYSFGLKTSFDLTRIKASSHDYFAPKLYFNLGILQNYKFKNKNQIQIEPGFIEKGARLINSYPTDYGSFKYGFITIPTVFITKLFDTLNLEIGSEFAFLIYAKEKSANGDVYSLIDPNFKHLEISGLIGISYNIRRNIYLGLRFGIGLTPIYNGYYDVLYGPDDSYKLYNIYLEFSLRANLIKFHKKLSAGNQG